MERPIVASRALTGRQRVPNVEYMRVILWVRTCRRFCHLCFKNKMGGKVSKARRACMTEKSSDYSASGDITVNGLGLGAKITKSYDMGCVQNMLNRSN
jgi:hypothetical protein